MNVVVKDKKKGRRDVTPSAPSIVLSSSQWGHMAKEAGSADRREECWWVAGKPGMSSPTSAVNTDQVIFPCGGPD